MRTGRRPAPLLLRLVGRAYPLPGIGHAQGPRGVETAAPGACSSSGRRPAPGAADLGGMMVTREQRRDGHDNTVSEEREQEVRREGTRAWDGGARELLRGRLRAEGGE